MRSRTLHSFLSFSFWYSRIRRRSKVRATELDYFQPGKSGPLEYHDVSSAAAGISCASACVHRGVSARPIDEYQARCVPVDPNQFDSYKARGGLRQQMRLDSVFLGVRRSWTNISRRSVDLCYTIVLTSRILNCYPANCFLSDFFSTNYSDLLHPSRCEQIVRRFYINLPSRYA